MVSCDIVPCLLLFTSIEALDISIDLLALDTVAGMREGCSVLVLLYT